MLSHLKRPWHGLGVLALILVASARAQDRIGKDEAALTVDGVVRETFRSPRQGHTDVLVQIDVQRSEGRKVVPGTARAAFPGPGDTVYVHVVQQPSAANLAGHGAAAALPPERAQVRAYLTPRSTGGWEAVSGTWFELTSDQPATTTNAAPAPAAPADPGAAGPALGMTLEAMKMRDRLVLRVTSVERGGPAEQAGLEVGDVIIGAKGAPLTGPDQIAELARGAEVIPLAVADVRTGRATQVEFRPGKKADSPVVDVAKPDAPAPAPAVRSLGVSAEKIALGQRTALKVLRVEPGSAGQKAGLEANDVLVAADGAPLTSPEQLGIALRKSGPTLVLTVRDSRTGRDVPVKVEFGGPAAPPSPAPELTPSTRSDKGSLGAVTELAFYDVEAAVKVTEVEPGSPAERAGLTPGILILKADGKAILHPNALNEAVRNSTGRLKLVTVDPRSGQKAEVEVRLAN